MSGSAIHAALSGLVSIWTPAGTSLGVQVVRCRPYDPSGNFLCVGWDPSDEAAVHGLRPSGNAGLAGDTESIDVSNFLSFWSGTDGIGTVEDHCIAAFDAFDAALAADRTLGDVAAGNTMVTETDYLPDIRAEGALVQIRFTVRINVL